MIAWSSFFNKVKQTDVAAAKPDAYVNVGCVALSKQVNVCSNACRVGFKDGFSPFDKYIGGTTP